MIHNSLIPFGPCVTVTPEQTVPSGEQPDCVCVQYYARTGTHAHDCPRSSVYENNRVICGDHDHAIATGYVVRVSEWGNDEESNNLIKSILGADLIQPGMKVHYRADQYAQIGDLRVISLAHIIAFEQD